MPKKRIVSIFQLPTLFNTENMEKIFVLELEY